MGMFNSKKNAENNDFSQEVPEFKPYSEKERTGLPELPVARSEKPMFPTYESDFNSVKREIQKPVFQQKVEMPARKPIMEFRQDHSAMTGDKPIYVKIDQYKDAVGNVERIKALCNEADKTLAEIGKIRASEDRELQKWHEDISRIKEKLLLVDKKIFEV